MVKIEKGSKVQTQNRSEDSLGPGGLKLMSWVKIIDAHVSALLITIKR